MPSMSPPPFRELIGRVSGLEADSDFVRAAVEAEAEERGELLQERAQSVADDARRRVEGWRRVTAKKRADEERELGPTPDAALTSKALSKRLKPWARELRKQGFGNPDAPFPGNLVAAADWIKQESTADRERWSQDSISGRGATEEIKRLANLAGLVVNTAPRFLKYVQPDREYRQQAGTFPDTFLDRLARETDRVSERTPFQPETLTAFVLTGLQPMISGVRITKTTTVCKMPGDDIPSRWVTLRFNAADVSYKEMRDLHAEIRKFFGAKNAERLSWHEFDFVTLVDSMGGPPEHGKTRFWEEVVRRWREEPASRHSPLNSWRAARNKFERLDGRRGIRELATPNPPPPPLTPEDWDRYRKQFQPPKGT